MTQFALGNLHTCALTDDDQVYCFGYNYDRQLGVGATVRLATPGPVLGL